MYLPILKRFLITALLLPMGLSTSSRAELMVPVDADKLPHQAQTENRLGGTIAKVDQKGLVINGVYYPFDGYSVKIHRMDGKITRRAMLKPGMLVSAEVIKHGQTVKISEIWVIKDE